MTSVITPQTEADNNTNLLLTVNGGDFFKLNDISYDVILNFILKLYLFFVTDSGLYIYIYVYFFFICKCD
jgi:hypothetical protein